MGQINFKKLLKCPDFIEIFYYYMTRLRNTNISTPNTEEHQYLFARTTLAHSFPMHPFPTLRFSDVFRG